jgi:muconolactone delta-isomerase
MQIMALLRRRIEAFTPEQFEPLLDAEAERVRQLYAQGFIRAAWTREDVPGGILLLESASLDEAHATLATLPLMNVDMSEATLIPLRGYRGFGPRG